MMMFGFGWLMMLLVIGLPVLLIVLLVAGAAGWYSNRANNIPGMQNQAPIYQAKVNANPPATQAARYCSHCGAGLQADWTHCPQCGAPIQ